MTVKLKAWLPLLLAMQALGGCSTIKSWFPDKERDYQFRAEIPELIVPEDLKASGLPARTTEQVAAAAVAAAEPVAQQAAPAEEPKRPAAETRKQAQTEAPVADKPAGQPAVGNSAVSSLQIDQAQKQAWRLVARALSRQRLEIVERNIDKAYFYVKYDPNATKPEDGSIMDEISFLFGEDPSHEQEYRISLLEIAPQITEVTVQDSEGKTISNAPATALLKLITDGINLDLSTDAPEPDKQPSP